MENDGAEEQLYGGMPPFEKSSDTSLAAASSVEHIASTLRELVFDVIEASGISGMTDDEIEVTTGMIGSTVRPRRRELYLLGRICKRIDSNGSSVKRDTRSGRSAQVHVVGRGDNIKANCRVCNMPVIGDAKMHPSCHAEYYPNGF